MRVLAVALLVAADAAAQTSRFALEAVAATDGVKDSTPRRDSTVWLDVFGAVRIVEGLEFVVRPVISKRAFDGQWQKQMYQLGVRYERPSKRDARIGLRVDVGQMASPIGIAMLENRPNMNPVVSQHSAYYLALPRVDPEIPRTFLIGAIYPFGSQVTMSGRGWDGRVAFIDSSPLRGRPFFGANKPPRLLNTVVGFGVTPHIGVRLGVGIAHGAYASVNEVQDRSRGDRTATMAQVEGEWSFGHTRLVGEVVRGTLETARPAAVVAGGWIEMTQTLAPRVFVSSRFDSQHFDYWRPAATSRERQRYERFEAVLGYRITPDLTIRGGYLGRQGYVVSHWDDQVIGSVVWQKKIW